MPSIARSPPVPSGYGSHENNHAQEAIARRTIVLDPMDIHHGSSQRLGQEHKTAYVSVRLYDCPGMTASSVPDV
jgi:hypothetical protein